MAGKRTSPASAVARRGPPPKKAAAAGRARGGVSRRGPRPPNDAQALPKLGGVTAEQRNAVAVLETLLASISNRDEYLAAVREVASLAPQLCLGDVTLTRLLEQRADALGLAQPVRESTATVLRQTERSIAEEGGEPFVRDPFRQEADRRGVSVTQVRLERDPVEVAGLIAQLSALPPQGDSAEVWAMRQARLGALLDLQMDQREAAIRQMGMDEFYSRGQASGDGPGIGGRATGWLPDVPAQDRQALDDYAQLAALDPARAALIDGLKTRWDAEHPVLLGMGTPSWTREAQRMAWVHDSEMGQDGFAVMREARRFEAALAPPERGPEADLIRQALVQDVIRNLAASPTHDLGLAVQVERERACLAEAGGDHSDALVGRVAFLEGVGGLRADRRLAVQQAFVNPLKDTRNASAASESWRALDVIETVGGDDSTRLLKFQSLIEEQLVQARKAGNGEVASDLERLAVLQVRSQRHGMPLNAEAAEPLLGGWREARAVAVENSWLTRDAAWDSGDVAGHAKHVAQAVDRVEEARDNARAYGRGKGATHPLRGQGLHVDAVARMALADGYVDQRCADGVPLGLFVSDVNREASMYAERQFTDERGKTRVSPEVDKARELFGQAQEVLRKQTPRGDRGGTAWRGEANQWLAAVAYDAVRHYSPDLSLTDVLEHQMRDSLSGERQLGGLSAGNSTAFLQQAALTLGVPAPPAAAVRHEASPTSPVGSGIAMDGLEYGRIVESVAFAAISADPAHLARADRVAAALSDAQIGSDVDLRAATEARSRGDLLTADQRYLVARQELSTHRGWMMAVEHPEMGALQISEAVRKGNGEAAETLDDLRMRDRFGVSSMTERRTLEGVDAYGAWVAGEHKERNADIRQVVSDLAADWKGVPPDRMATYQLLARHSVNGLEADELQSLEQGPDVTRDFRKFWDTAQRVTTDVQHATMLRPEPADDPASVLAAGRSYAELMMRSGMHEGAGTPEERFQAARMAADFGLARDAMFEGASVTEARQAAAAFWKSPAGTLETLRLRDAHEAASPVQALVVEGAGRFEDGREGREQMRVTEVRAALDALSAQKSVTAVLENKNHGDLWELMAHEKYAVLLPDEQKRLAEMRQDRANERAAGWFEERWATALTGAERDDPSSVQALRGPEQADPALTLAAGRDFAVARLSLGREALWASEGADAASFRLLALEGAEALRPEEQTAAKALRAAPDFNQTEARFLAARANAGNLIERTDDLAERMARGELAAAERGVTMAAAQAELRAALAERGEGPSLSGVEQLKLIQAVGHRAEHDPLGTWEVVREDMTRHAVGAAEQAFAGGAAADSTAVLLLNMPLRREDGSPLLAEATRARLGDGFALATGNAFDASHPSGVTGLDATLGSAYREQVVEIARAHPGVSLEWAENHERARLVEALAWDMPAGGWPADQDRRYEIAVLDSMVPTVGRLLTDTQSTIMLTDVQTTQVQALRVAQEALDEQRTGGIFPADESLAERYRRDVFERAQMGGDALFQTAPDLQSIQIAQMEHAASGIPSSLSPLLAVEGFAPGVESVTRLFLQTQIRDDLVSRAVADAEARTGLTVSAGEDYRQRVAETIRQGPSVTFEETAGRVTARALGSVSPGEEETTVLAAVALNNVGGGGEISRLPVETRALLGAYDNPLLRQAARAEAVSSAVEALGDADREALARVLEEAGRPPPPERVLWRQAALPGDAAVACAGFEQSVVDDGTGGQTERFAVRGTTEVIDVAVRAADLMKQQPEIEGKHALLLCMGVVDAAADGGAAFQTVHAQSASRSFLALGTALDMSQKIGLDGEEFREILNGMNTEFAPDPQTGEYERGYQIKGAEGKLVAQHVRDNRALANDPEFLKKAHRVMGNAIQGPTSEALSIDVGADPGVLALSALPPEGVATPALSAQYFGPEGLSRPTGYDQRVVAGPGDPMRVVSVEGEGTVLELAGRAASLLQADPTLDGRTALLRGMGVVIADPSMPLLESAGFERVSAALDAGRADGKAIFEGGGCPPQIEVSGAPGMLALDVTLPGQNLERGEQVLAYLDAVGSYAAANAGTTPLTINGIRDEIRTAEAAHGQSLHPLISDGAFDAPEESPVSPERVEAERREALRALALGQDVRSPSALIEETLAAAQSRFEQSILDRTGGDDQRRQEELNRAILSGSRPSVEPADVEAATLVLEARFDQQMAEFLSGGAGRMLTAQNVSELRVEAAAQDEAAQNGSDWEPSEYDRLLDIAVRSGGAPPLPVGQPDVVHVIEVAQYGIEIAYTGLDPEMFLALNPGERVDVLRQAQVVSRERAVAGQIEAAAVGMEASLHPGTQEALRQSRIETPLEWAAHDAMDQARLDVGLACLDAARKEAAGEPNRSVADMVRAAQMSVLAVGLAGWTPDAPVPDVTAALAAQPWTGEIGERVSAAGVHQRETAEQTLVAQDVAQVAIEARRGLEARGDLPEEAPRESYLRLLQEGAVSDLSKGGQLSLLGAQREAVSGLKAQEGPLDEGAWHLVSQPGVEQGVMSLLTGESRLSDADRERLTDVAAARSQMNALRAFFGDAPSEPMPAAVPARGVAEVPDPVRVAEAPIMSSEAVEPSLSGDSDAQPVSREAVPFVAVVKGFGSDTGVTTLANALEAFNAAGVATAAIKPADLGAVSDERQAQEGLEAVVGGALGNRVKLTAIVALPVTSEGARDVSVQGTHVFVSDSGVARVGAVQSIREEDRSSTIENTGGFSLD